mmetsp:Transcript_43299/g.50859  ORF Transcript_43299/g.50859 Transcript_43299/m.50859 type:complete len:242 (+) Transcript_43299:3414-4139(+)
MSTHSAISTFSLATSAGRAAMYSLISVSSSIDEGVFLILASMSSNLRDSSLFLSRALWAISLISLSTIDACLPANRMRMSLQLTLKYETMRDSGICSSSLLTSFWCFWMSILISSTEAGLSKSSSALTYFSGLSWLSSLNTENVSKNRCRGSMPDSRAFSMLFDATQSQVFSSGRMCLRSGTFGSVGGISGAFSDLLPCVFLRNRCLSKMGSSWGISCSVLMPCLKISITVLTTTSGGVEY